jgi:hypothetical protein
MATLMLDEGGADLEMEYESMGEYRERLDHARVKTAQFLVGGAEDMVNNGQSVISSLAIIRGNLFYMINWNPICVLWNQLE